MNKNISNQKILPFATVYLIVLICDLVCSSNDEYLHLRFYTKPSIIGSLIIFLFTQRKSMVRSTFRITMLALIFSLFGDIFLLFTQTSQLFFITGLVMFLFAHIMYIVIFFKQRENQRKNRLFSMFTIGYGVILFYVLYPGLEKMLIPVILYMIVILLMSNASFIRSELVSKKSYILVLAGSLFFMLSDSLLAIDMFYTPLPLGNIWIMLTYASAQFLIVYGIMNQKELLRS
ncbi:lysoplasmalogenase [Aquimarina mytili]|uniref:Lysoplasmalogenase n=1 Tax=Aquimarina mytili TaxID=874423 RepID=A0A936ZPB7_9FLAO|nr:lysoplasmalogenase [Aquimarina mytili]MBL0682248.1 lysoplasmalogenase [Aquimarina mytili]